MKKFLLIVMMFVLPLQAFASMEHNLAHLVGGKDMALVIKHIAEHVAEVPHHHDNQGDEDAGNVHEDNSSKSIQHLADHEHYNGLNILFLAPAGTSLMDAVAIAPHFAPVAFISRDTVPLLRPPRAAA